MSLELGVLEGDGIGPEIVSSARRAIDATGADVEFTGLPVGWEGYEEYGSTVPERTLDRLEELDGWLLGPVLSGQYPEDDAADRNPSNTLRTAFDLYSNVRPIRSLGDVGPEGMDVTIFRQNTEGFMADRNMEVGEGQFMPTEDLAMSVRVVTRKESRRIAEAAFEYAAAESLDTVSAVHKGNVLRHGGDVFEEECRSVSEEYPGVELQTHLVDAFAMELAANPTEYDVVVTTNLFGDILSDEAAGVVGSLGLAPGLNHSDEAAMAQATHGAAPDIAGEGIANPSAMILSASQLLEWLGRRGAEDAATAATALEDAVARTLREGVRTPDVGGDASTDEFTDAVVENI